MSRKYQTLQRGDKHAYTKVGLNLFLPTVPTFAVRETDVSRHNWGTNMEPS